MEAAPPLSARSRALMLSALIIAGEAIFFLPFVIPRVFRPTFLEVFGITNLQLGSFISVYGVVAMVAYFFAGPLSDKYPARLLMSLAGLQLLRPPRLLVEVLGRNGRTGTDSIRRSQLHGDETLE